MRIIYFLYFVIFSIPLFLLTSIIIETIFLIKTILRNEKAN